MKLALFPLVSFGLLFLMAPSEIRVHANDDDDDDDDDDECLDREEKCPTWASTGECERNPHYMFQWCRHSCQVCEDDDDDEDEDDEEEIKGGYQPYTGDFEFEFDEDEDDKELELVEVFDKAQRGLDLGIPQKIHYDDGTRVGDIMWILAKARSYMNHWVPYQIGEGIEKFCRNYHKECAYWALHGGCETNVEYMKARCGPVCGSCSKFTMEERCPLDPNAPNAWGPGDLNAMFERLTSEPFLSLYGVQILSSPDTTDGPWVITMDNMVTEEEALRLIQLGGMMGYKRSMDIIGQRADGRHIDIVSEGRTSTNAWCLDVCEDDEIVKRVTARFSNLTGIPDTNAERLQLLRYQQGQFYETHQDMIDHQVDQQGGHRILTVFLYLNEVKEGGCTKFDELELTVMPKRGRVVIWPNVYDEDPLDKDYRTKHQALEVIDGVKYGANAWYHMRDFKTASDNGCT